MMLDYVVGMIANKDFGEVRVDSPTRGCHLELENQLMIRSQARGSRMMFWDNGHLRPLQRPARWWQGQKGRQGQKGQHAPRRNKGTL